MTKSILVEICCGTLDDCLVAINNQVDRIELNCALELGGLTPSVATLRALKKLTTIPVCCMVRPRSAGFCYSDSLYQVMLQDAAILLDNQADGIVFGFLNPDNTVAKKRTKEMAELIHGYKAEAIFHKAFDSCPDLLTAAEALVDSAVDRVLTGGGQSPNNILNGALLLAELNKLYGQKLTFLPGGGVNATNIRHILDISGCKEIHMTAKQNYLDQQTYVAVDDTTLKSILAQI